MNSLSNLPFAAIINQRRWIFIALLCALHLVFVQTPDSQLGRLLFLTHVGIGLLWQPFVQPRRRVGFIGSFWVVMFAGISAYYLNWVWLLIWTMLLCGVVGGKVFLFHDRWERFFHLLGLGYLASAVLLLILPNALLRAHVIPLELVLMAHYFLPVIFALMLALPVKAVRIDDRAEIVDYIYGVLTFLLLAVVVLGSISFSLLFQVSYYESLFFTLGLTSVILLLLGLIWDPRAGFGGLGSAVVQHVMSVGLPLEDWLELLAKTAQSEESPVGLLEKSCASFPDRLPGVVGGRWETTDRSGEFGKPGRYQLSIQHGPLKLVLQTAVDPSPVLRWHYDLSVRLLAEIYLGKWRAQELKRLSFIEAIHETGARLTHDVKNLLQSLDTLCAAANLENDASSLRFRELLRRQLPEISMRLRHTLDKLAAPVTGTEVPLPMSAMTWFGSIEDRYAAPWLSFKTTGHLADVVLPDSAMLTTVAENLLQNLQDKQRNCPGMRAELQLMESEGKVQIEVSDNGRKVSSEVAAGLFRQRVPSENGLGIGLYQSARLAHEQGWALALISNREGEVRFRLAPSDPATRGPG